MGCQLENVPASNAYKITMPVVVDGFQLQKDAKVLKYKSTKTEIPMSGLKFIFNREVPLLRRIFWTCVINSIIIASIIHVVHHVHEYIYTETHQHSVPEKADGLPFPIVTLCGQNTFRVRRIKELKLAKAVEEDAITRTNIRARRFQSTCYNVNPVPPSCWDLSDLIGYDGMNVKDIWDAVAQKPEDMIDECWFGKNVHCNQVGFWSPIYTYMGVCHSFFLNTNFVDLPGKFNNLYVVLNERETELYNGTSGWKMIIHDWVDSPVIDIRNQGFTLDLGYSKEIRIHYRHVNRLNIPRHPCIPDNDDYTEGIARMKNNAKKSALESHSKCIERCFVKTASNIMTCRLPFMKNDDDDQLEYCTTPESYTKSAKILEKFFSSQWLTKNCSNCLPMCHKHDYIAEEMTEMKESNDSVSTFRVFYRDFIFKVVTEHPIKTGYDLFSDIGGSLGLLLGFSVLSVIEIVDAAIHTCVKCIFSKLLKEFSAESI